MKQLLSNHATELEIFDSGMLSSSVSCTHMIVCVTIQCRFQVPSRSYPSLGDNSCFAYPENEAVCHSKIFSELSNVYEFQLTPHLCVCNDV